MYLNTLGLTSYEKTIATAMQEYGFMVVDTGGDSGIGFYAIDPKSVTGNMYAGLWPADDFVLLSNLDVNTLPLRVLKLPPQDPDFQAKLALHTNRFVNYQ